MFPTHTPTCISSFILTICNQQITKKKAYKELIERAKGT